MAIYAYIERGLRLEAEKRRAVGDMRQMAAHAPEDLSLP
jgi:hypothetical protein